jgi:hypothetical protein
MLRAIAHPNGLSGAVNPVAIPAKAGIRKSSGNCGGSLGPGRSLSSGRALRGPVGPDD